LAGGALFHALDPQSPQQMSPLGKSAPDRSILGNFTRACGHGQMVLAGFDFFHLHGEVQRLTAVRHLQEGMNYD
jgi:hypothetical protein